MIDIWNQICLKLTKATYIIWRNFIKFLLKLSCKIRNKEGEIVPRWSRDLFRCPTFLHLGYISHFLDKISRNNFCFMLDLFVLNCLGAICLFLLQENVIWGRVRLEAMPIWGSHQFVGAKLPSVVLPWPLLTAFKD